MGRSELQRREKILEEVREVSEQNNQEKTFMVSYCMRGLLTFYPFQKRVTAMCEAEAIQKFSNDGIIIMSINEIKV